MPGTSPSFAKIDIVCFSLSRWDAPISSPAVSIAKELSKHHRVFFIEHPYSYKDRLTTLFVRRASKRLNVPASNERQIHVVHPPTVLPVNFLPEGNWYDTLSNVNNNMLTRTLRRTLKQHKISRYLFINCFDPFFLRSIPVDIRPEKYVYQCMDDISQVNYTMKHGVRLEEETIRRADCTICTSRELTRLKAHQSPNVHFLPNGADTTLFNTAATQTLLRPTEMHFPGKKIIGFTGSIEYRTDVELLQALASFHSDKILVMVGPVYGKEVADAGLDRMPNVVFTGARDLSELPAYLQYMDCTIIPYKKNVLTKSIYPLKINEYLAAGKPVVATDFSEDVNAFHENLYIAGTREAFIQAVEIAIREDGPQKRQQRMNAAAANSWTARVDELWSIISAP